MRISFFQTYGDRLPLLKIRLEDSLFQKFLQSFDLNIISLHNVTDNVKNFVKDNYKNFTIFDFKNISYCQCIKNLMDFLKDKNISKFFFYQDDTFSCEVNEKSLEELIKLSFNDYDMINISYKAGHLIEKGKWNTKNKLIINHNPYFNLYNTTTFDFRDSTLWAFDDSCFICNYNTLKNIFDDQYFTFPDIWHAELYLKNIFERVCMSRFITNVSFFINYNILGRNTNPKNIEHLKKNIILSEETNNLLLHYYSGN